VLGGTDKDVKQYFFSLPAKRLTQILDVYERQYGAPARRYAEAAYDKWRTGSTQMSGLVADRLFTILPPLMPLADKYRLTEKLWDHYGPSSKKVLRVGLNVGAADVAAAFKDHFESVVSSFTLPEALEARFSWLSGGDVSVRRQLLEHNINAERALIAESVRRNVTVLFDHLAADTENATERAAHIVKIKKHELEILIDPKAEGLSLEDPPPPFRYTPGTSGNPLGCFIAIAVVLGLLWLFGHHH
jgi:hypothetical protein